MTHTTMDVIPKQKPTRSRFLPSSLCELVHGERLEWTMRDSRVNAVQEVSLDKRNRMLSTFQ
jgi:hypothetical protein